jgi:hypothetical protein
MQGLRPWSQGLPLRQFLASAPVLLPTGTAAVLATVLGVGWFTQPDRYATGYAPVQPIPYSHKLHAGTLRIPCLYCHGNAERSPQAGVPAVETCRNCHRVTKTDSAPIVELARIYSSGEPLRWERIHALPDHVYFDHRPHVHAGILCQTCHGEVQTMEILSQEMSLRMGNCLGCHRDAHAALPPGSPARRGAEHCNGCHR